MKNAQGMMFVTILFMDLLTGMEFDLFAPSFPELQRHFNLSPFWVEALLSVNFAGYGLSLFCVGGLADRYGRKPIILLGLLIFMGGSLLCLWSPFYSFLLAGRFFQGVGIAAPAVLSFLIIADSYPLKQQLSLFALLNGLMNAAVGAGPVLGSYITLYFHWQGNFMVLLLFGLLSLGMTLLFIPSGKIGESKEPLSWRGYLPIFRSKPQNLLMTNLIFSFLPYWVFVGMSPLLYMEDLGVSLSHFGYYQGVLALTFGIGTLLFTGIVHRYRPEKLLYLALFLLSGSLLTLGAVTFLNSASPLVITLSFLPFIIAQIIPSAILQPLCLNLMPQAKGRVSALLQGGRLIGSILSLQGAGYFYQGSFQNIGFIITFFIFLTLFTLYFVVEKGELMKKIHSSC